MPGTQSGHVSNSLDQPYSSTIFICCSFIRPPCNEISVVVIAAGDLWIVNAHERTAVRTLPALEAIMEVHNPEGWIFSRQGIALARLGPAGLMWHTRRLSWDGFDQLHMVQDELRGLAWSPIDDKWYPFTVELSTGKSTGGSYSPNDSEGWETLTS